MPSDVMVLEKPKKAGRPKKKAGHPKGKVAKKKAGRPTKKVATMKAATRGWPKGKKRGKKRGRKPGRPTAKVAVKAIVGGMTLITDGTADLTYWSEFVSFLNANTGKAFNIQTDGTNFTLHAS